MLFRTVALFITVCLIVTTSHAETAKNKSENIAPFAIITSNPYCGTLQYLIDGEIPANAGGKMAEGEPFFEEVEKQSDGNISTFACFPIRSSKQQISFKFPVQISVDKIRLYQRSAHSKTYHLEGDADGDGKFEMVLAKIDSAQPDNWSVTKFSEPKSVKAIRFTSIKNSGRGAPQICEFQIFSNKETADTLKKASLKSHPQKKVGTLTFSKPNPFPINKTVPKENKYQFGACCCLWMFINQTTPYIGQKEANKVAFETMKDLDMQRMRLFVNLRPKSIEKVKFPTDPVYTSRIYPSDINTAKRFKGLGYDCAPWPSEVLISYKENILKRFVEDAKKHNIDVSVMPPRNGPPFDVRSGYYPMAQADRHTKRPDSRFPCVWHGGYWKPAFKKILGEIVSCGVKGIEVVPDEFYIEGHNLQRMPGNDPCRKLFKEQYGVDVPKKVDDTDTYRKWVLFQYNSTAKTFSDFIDSVKSQRPDIHTETNLSVAPLLFYNSPGFTLALDIVGHTGKYDSFGTDPYYRLDTLGHYQMPKTSVIFQGATPSRNVSMLLQAVCGDWITPLSDPVWIAGNATSVLMRGVHEIDFYRLNYFAPISTKAKTHPVYFYLRNWIKMIRALESLELKKAIVPKDVALIYSRAGVDWWELTEKINARKKSGNKYLYPNSAMAGYAHHDVVMELFFKNGQPFDLFFLDQETLKNALDYKVIVIPFAYSISQDALKILKKALEKDIKILIIGKKGETNELGVKYPKPLLEELIGKPGVEYLDLDLLKNGNSPETKAKILGAVDKLLGNNKQFFVNTHSKDVEVGLLKNKNGIYFIPIVNWHNQDVTVDLGIKVASGTYRVSRYNLDGVSLCRLNDVEKDVFTDSELRNFSFNVPKHDTMFLVIQPK